MRELRRKPQFGQVDRAENDQQRQQRQGDHPIGEPHQHGIHALAEVAGDHADGESNDASSRRGQHADQERNLPAQHQPHQFVPPRVVGSQRVFGGGRAVLRQQIRFVRIDAQKMRHWVRGGDERHQQGQHDKTSDAGAMVSKSPPPQTPGRDGPSDRAISRAGAHSAIRGSSQP